MSEQQPRFPRWLGPVLGAGVGVVLALRAMRRDRVTDWTWVAGGVVLGALAGGVLWLVDAPTPANPRRASVPGSLLAVLAIFPGLLPFVGLVFGVPAFLVNRRVVGWQNRASRLGLGLSLLLTIVVVAASRIPLN